MATLLLALFAAGFLWVSATPKFMVGAYQNKVMAPPATLLGKVKERVRLWLRSRNLVPVGNVVTEARIIAVDYPLEPGLLALLTNSPFRETREVQGWIVDQARADEWRSRLEGAPGTFVVASPRIVASSHQAGVMFTGGSAFLDGTNLTDYGLQVATLPRIAGQKIALTVDALNTDVVRVEASGTNEEARPIARLQTNLAFSAEALLPPETVLLILAKPEGTQGVAHAVIISARVEPEQ